VKDLLRFLLAILVLAFAGATSYVAYNLYFVEDLFVDVTAGTYRGFAVGMTREEVRNRIYTYAEERHRNHVVEIDFLIEGVQQEFGVDASRPLENAHVEEFLGADTWVIYLCKNECGWRKHYHWMSFVFSGDSLVRVAEWKKRRWELP
jgi:hypothetical protein